MHYTFDIINCMLFVAAVFILVVQKWQFSKRHRAVYGMVVTNFVYLAGAVYYAFSWHARTGKAMLEPFFAFDTLYFVTLSLMLGFMMLYFADICLGRTKRWWLIFPLPLLMAVIFLFINPKNGMMFRYVDGEYTRGPFLISNYILWAVYMLTMIILTFRARNRLGYRTLAGLLLFFAYEIALQVYQFFVVDFYTGGVAYTTGLLYLIIAPLFLEPGRDEMTGLYNRQGFSNTVREILRYEEDTDYCIASIDINNFRGINERFGFRVGNKILAHMGKYLNEQFPDVEIIARFNADHFFLCCPKSMVRLSLPDIPIMECAPEVVEPYTVKLYQGVYPITNREEDVSQMCDRAVFALQQVKGDYRRQVGFFDVDAQKQLQLKNYILQEMKNALRNRDFVVYYQPVVDVRNNTVVGAEALLRWMDEKYGMISPASFIPLYEENSSVSELDLFVCREVCAKIAEWKRKRRGTVPISVNVSRVDLSTPGFLDAFTAIVTDKGLSPEDLRVEITESAFIRTEDIERQLETLHRMGFKILMDDFGSGYSNFNTFASMPVDIIKADMGFMANLVGSERGQGVLSSISEMANKLSMPIVAEGVETKEQVESLRAMGICYVQGYYYARPMPAENLEKMLWEEE